MDETIDFADEPTESDEERAEAEALAAEDAAAEDGAPVEPTTADVTETFDDGVPVANEDVNDDFEDQDFEDAELEFDDELTPEDYSDDFFDINIEGDDDDEADEADEVEVQLQRHLSVDVDTYVHLDAADNVIATYEASEPFGVELKPGERMIFLAAGDEAIRIVED